MKLKVSIEAVGWYLGSLVSSYNDDNGVPPDDPRDYLPEVPELVARLRHGGEDAAFIRAALEDLVEGDSLTSKVAAYLCSWANMDIEPERLRPILRFMLQQIDEHVSPKAPDTDEVELVSMGLHPSEWRPTQAQLNANIRWLPRQHARNPQRSVVAPAPCPQAGFWFTAARSGSRRYFRSQEVMPATNGDFGATVWQWDQNQNPPKL